MLVLWARWPFPLLMLGAMVVLTLSEPWRVPVMLGLAGAWALATLSAIVRTLRDYRATTFSPTSLLVAMGFANPLPLFLLLIFFLTFDADPVFLFFWHLATRS